MKKTLISVLRSLAGVALFPIAAFADNCGSWTDCFNVVASAAAAAASIATGTALLSWISGLFGDDTAGAAPPPDPNAPVGWLDGLLDGIGKFVGNLTDQSTWSGVAAAIFGGILGGMEKFTEWSKIAQSYNPRTGFPIPGTHLEYPYKWVGATAKGVGGAIALGTQFKESMDIWGGKGSVGNRAAKEVVSLGTNVAVAFGSAALVEASAATGPGVVLGLAGAVAMGAAGEGLKAGLYNAVDHFLK